MLWIIFFDICKGFFTSLRFDKVIFIAMKNDKLSKLYMKIIKYNFILFCVPWIINKIMCKIFNLLVFYPISILYWPISIFSIFFHAIHYIDLINIAAKYNVKHVDNNDVVSVISQSIIMTLYQVVIYLTINAINFFIGSSIGLLSLLISFFILTIYHSFYAYNNLWQSIKIDMAQRIDMHEKLWPYYIGYGIVPSLIYYYTSGTYNVGFYNIYMIVILAMPFFIEPTYPRKIMHYPSINLKVFSFFVKMLFIASKYLTKKIV